MKSTLQAKLAWVTKVAVREPIKAGKTGDAVKAR
jgi:hypothetical protein